MSKTLVWRPQEAFKPYFYTEPSEIIKNRSVFRLEYTNFISYGGRGSGKTYTFADAVIVEASLRKIRVLVTREIQLSIEESIKAELEKAIYARGLENFFTIQKTEIIGLNGSKFIFRGLKNNIANIKSISNVDIALCEESENITKDSWDKFLPSIRPESGRPIVIVIFNPQSELDDTYQRWVINTPPNSIKRLINWRDNEYFPEFLNEQRLHSEKTMPRADYEHIWEGKPTGSGGDIIIDLAWVQAARFASQHTDWPKAEGKRVGYDPAGQGRDSNSVSYLDGNRLVAIDEWVKSPNLREATERAIDGAFEFGADVFRYDECGGFGDGVSVFIDDAIKKHPYQKIRIAPFNAGSGVVDADAVIEGTEKTNGETYSNAKAQAHGVTAQLYYNTYRFIVLGERDIPAEQLISIDIEDEQLYLKLARELSSPLWVRSATNSKKKVESKKDMEKRTGQPSPNNADSHIMTLAPEPSSSAQSLVNAIYSRRRR